MNLPLGGHAGVFDGHCPEFTLRLLSLFRESVSFLLFLRKRERTVIGRFKLKKNGFVFQTVPRFEEYLIFFNMEGHGEGE